MVPTSSVPAHQERLFVPSLHGNRLGQVFVGACRKGSRDLLATQKLVAAKELSVVSCGIEYAKDFDSLVEFPVDDGPAFEDEPHVPFTEVWAVFSHSGVGSVEVCSVADF